MFLSHSVHPRLLKLFTSSKLKRIVNFQEKRIKGRSFIPLSVTILRCKSTSKNSEDVCISPEDHLPSSRHSQKTRFSRMQVPKLEFAHEIASNKFDNTNFYLNQWENGLFLDDLNSTDLSKVAERFKLKGLNVDYFYRYRIKVTSELTSLLFPLDSIVDRELSAIQRIIYNKEEENVVSLTTFKQCGNVLLFGWSLVKANRRDVIVVVSDPLDAIAVNQETDAPVISLSSNFSHFSSELMTILKSFQKVILWLKPDHLNDEAKTHLGESLKKNVLLVRYQDYSNALSCLQSGLKIRSILKDTEFIYLEGVDRLSPYRSLLLDQFKNVEKHSGLKWKRFSALNDILRGHRKSELTVFTGQTGTGKTTFVSEYSLDLCMQGLPTLWVNLELSNERLLKIMFCQYAQCSFVENVGEFHEWFDKFEKLPMYILNTRARRSLKEMFEAMRLCARVYNVQHVVMDNLQFLMNIENFNSSTDQLRRQDEIFGAFRGFASRHNCHVTLVIHPRKEPEFTELNNASISGTAKATQEADNILILQSTKTRQYLHVTKNRFDGTKGCIVVEFDRSNYTFKQRKVNPSDGSGQTKLL